ncbi:jg19164 [Pararge aegeria aegeria]|uniref:Jg19164 protein n=1 Tax=Pararge aegeria aegeria TaxID=348720 RepID=A0A8S4R852_9NEOP|nr:jg19164 [Pararge aegeria aegeria]
MDKIEPFIYYYIYEPVIAQWAGARLYFRGAEFEPQHAPLTFLIYVRISLSSTVKENFVRKPTYLRVLHNVLKGNWVEDRIECPKGGTYYFPPKERIDYQKLESRQLDFRLNKLNGLQGYVHAVVRHDSHATCGNFATTTDVVYNHLPKPLCGPIQRYYKRSAHQFYPQPDLMKCFGNVTEWGLKKYLEHEWKCTDVSDYSSTLYEDTYVPPMPHQYLQRCERKARNSLVLVLLLMPHGCRIIIVFFLISFMSHSWAYTTALIKEA